MQDLITDIETLRRLSQEREAENHRFRNFLKTRLEWTDRELDEFVREVWLEVAERTDCTACGNCCKTMALTYCDGDVERLARHVGMSVLEFEARYVVRDEFGQRIASDTPCPFLEGTICSVYEHRPTDCRSFPHLHKKNFRSRLINVIDYSAECPMVFSILEELKGRLWLRGSHV